VKPARRRELACRAKLTYGVSIRIACDVLSISTTCYFYKPTLVDENAEIEDWLKRLTTTHKRWGFGLCFDFLRNIKGFKWNHKRVYRIYRELELNLRIKPKSRIKRDKPETLAVPAEINQVWSTDFMSDSLKNGHSMRTFNVIDVMNDARNLATAIAAVKDTGKHAQGTIFYTLSPVHNYGLLDRFGQVNRRFRLRFHLYQRHGGSC